MKIACKCGSTEMTFIHLAPQDLGEGWECPVCEKNLQAIKNPEPQASTPEVAAAPQTEVPQPSKSKKKTTPSK